MAGTITNLERVREALGLSDTEVSEDPWLAKQIIPAAESVIMRLAHAKLQATITNLDFYSGNGSRWLVLRRRPVYSITDIWEDADAFFGQGSDAWPDEEKLESGSEYALKFDDVDEAGIKISRCGIVFRLGGFNPFTGDAYIPGASVGVAHGPRFQPNDLSGWPRGTGNIRVDYVAGWSAAGIPEQLRLAATQLACTWHDEPPGMLSVKSQSLGDYSVTFGEDSAAVAELAGMVPKTIRDLIQPYAKMKGLGAG